VADIVKQHWKLFGRNYYSRYDYEECDSKAAADMMEYLVGQTKLLKPGILSAESIETNKPHYFSLFLLLGMNF
jgi:phosphoglucomutase